MPAATRTALTSLTPRRRRRNDAPACQLRIGPVHVFSDQLLVRIDRERAWLTPREMEVLAVFAGQPGRLLTRAEIYEQIWKRPFVMRDRTVDVHVRRLRIKLAEANNRWEYIHTHQGGGYRFEPEPAGGTSLARYRRR